MESIIKVVKYFIRNPGAAWHYGAKNRMPASPPEQMTDADLDLLVRWLTHDYLPTEVEDYPNRISELPGGGDESNAAEEDPTETQE